MKSKIEKRNIILYILGNGVSQLGSIIYSFAIGLYVLNTTGSGMKFATTLILAFIPMIVLTPFAGVFADRFDRKRIVVIMDLMNGLLFLVVFAYIYLRPLNLLVIYLTSFVTNILTTFFGIAFESAKPQLVEEENLQRINSTSQIIMAGSGILGPMLGGAVYAMVDIRLFILFNGLSFIGSGLSEILIDFNYNKKIPKTNSETFKGVFASMKGGFIYLMGKKKIMKLFSYFLALNIAISIAIQVPLPYILNNYLKLSSSTYGVISGVFPVGMIIGAVLVGKFTEKYTNNKLFLGLSYITSLLIIMVGIPVFISILLLNQWTSLIYFSIIMISFGFIVSLIDVPIMTMLQRSIEEEYRGRAFGILIPMIKIINPIGYFIAGALVNIINPFYVPLSVGIILLIFVYARKNILMGHIIPLTRDTTETEV